MTTTSTRDSCIVFNTTDFQEKIRTLSYPFVKQFFRINRNYIFFHTFFIFALSLQTLNFGLFFSTLLQSTAMAFSLAALFLTLFTYFVLLFYLQGRKPEKLAQLRDEYIEGARTCIPFDPGSLEYHCCITEAIVHMISQLRIASASSRWILASETLTYLTEKFRIWTRWKDLLKIKEMLLLATINPY